MTQESLNAASAKAPISLQREVPVPASENPNPYKYSTPRRWVNTIASKTGWMAVSTAAGGAAVLVSKPLEHMTSGVATTSLATAIYGGMLGTLVAVGERVVHKQTTDGYSPSWGAMFAHERARKKTTDENTITRRTYGGYLGEVLAEEAIYAGQAIALAQETDAKTALVYAAGTAAVAIATNIAKHRTLRAASGPPILFPETRGKLQAKTRVTKVFTRDK